MSGDVGRRPPGGEGKRPLEHASPEAIPDALLPAAGATGEAETVEEPIVVGGSMRVCPTTKAPLRDSSGEVIGVVGASIDPGVEEGIAFATERHRHPADLVRDADRALYEAKEAGGDRVTVFDGD